jgi:hypothetical protein
MLPRVGSKGNHESYERPTGLQLASNGGTCDSPWIDSTGKSDWSATAKDSTGLNGYQTYAEEAVKIGYLWEGTGSVSKLAQRGVFGRSQIRE